MSKKGRSRQFDDYAQAGRPDREAKRERFADQRGRGKSAPGLRPTTLITIGAVALGIVFVMLMTFNGNSSPGAVAAAALEQVPATTAATEGGKVSISEQEVREKKLVYWDYEEGNAKTPLLAYVTPSGAVKMAARMCEPCNGFSFRVEGNQLVCNSCGTRWDLETSKGISGGCQTFPPEVLEASVDGGKLLASEEDVASWKPRV